MSEYQRKFSAPARAETKLQKAVRLCEKSVLDLSSKNDNLEVQKESDHPKFPGSASWKITFKNDYDIPVGAVLLSIQKSATETDKVALSITPYEDVTNRQFGISQDQLNLSINICANEHLQVWKSAFSGSGTSSLLQGGEKKIYWLEKDDVTRALDNDVQNLLNSVGQELFETQADPTCVSRMKRQQDQACTL